MVAYRVNNEYFFNKEKAFEKAKNVIRKRYHNPLSCSENWKINKTEKENYNIQIYDDWQKIGNIKLLRITVYKIEIL